MEPAVHLGAGARCIRVPKTVGVLMLALATGSAPAPAQQPRAETTIEERLQALLDSAQRAAQWPGATLGVALRDGRVLAVATGFSDTTRRVAMRPNDRLLQGSVGKTYVAAVALQLVGEGKLSLDAPISTWLGVEPWFDRLPNARAITVRHLMQHTSGLVRYEFNPAATARLRAEPFRTWTPEERLAYVFDTQPPFAAGAGWEYSDTNYIVLGMILERITGRPWYDLLRERLLEPLALRETVAADRRQVPGLVNGYAGAKNDLGGYDASMTPEGLAINPQFEWTGGGLASTTGDLARWAHLLYTGRVIDTSLVRQMVTGVPARLGPNVRYGLGAIVRDTPLGAAWGHSGFFPGYATEMLYVPALGIAAAVQVNVTDPYPRGLAPLLLSVIAATAER